MGTGNWSMWLMAHGRPGEWGLGTDACGSGVMGGLENWAWELKHVVHGSWEDWRMGTGNWSMWFMGHWRP